MPLCDNDVKNQGYATAQYKQVNKKLDSIALMKAIKKIVYTDGTNNLLTKHDKAIAYMNYMSLYREVFKKSKNSLNSTWIYAGYLMNDTESLFNHAQRLFSCTNSIRRITHNSDTETVTTQNFTGIRAQRHRCTINHVVFDITSLNKRSEMIRCLF